ncbi:hypothetical protein, partial [Actinoplanes awajinensis]|uniref:hypothetical protein n=1 Tax=Actinoplanes awajinensis TaxID=135946 RepID=UPI001E2E27B7
QRPTHNPIRKTPASTTLSGMNCEIVPGIEDQPLTWLFFQIPNRMLVFRQKSSRTTRRSATVNRVY